MDNDVAVEVIDFSENPVGSLPFEAFLWLQCVGARPILLFALLDYYRNAYAEEWEWDEEHPLRPSNLATLVSFSGPQHVLRVLYNMEKAGILEFIAAGDNPIEYRLHGFPSEIPDEVRQQGVW